MVNLSKAMNEVIKALRVRHGLNQVEFAKRIGVTKQCISNWENDNVQPSIEMLVKIADFFGVTTDYILGRNGEQIICADGLTEQQYAHIRLLVKDIEEANRRCRYIDSSLNAGK